MNSFFTIYAKNILILIEFLFLLSYYLFNTFITAAKNCFFNITLEKLETKIMLGNTILHYKIIEKLGEGGMGVVYKANDSELNRIVALKFIPGYLMDKPRLRTRLKREARAAASLNHSNICTIFGFHETDEFIFIVMEYIEGLTLKQLIEKEAPIDEVKAKEIAIQIAKGLSAAHQNNIIHRDIKSDNIMLTKDGKVKIMDFGLAKMEHTPTITRSKSPMGTVAYMSPELVIGKVWIISGVPHVKY